MKTVELFDRLHTGALGLFVVLVVASLSMLRPSQVWGEEAAGKAMANSPSVDPPRIGVIDQSASEPTVASPSDWAESSRATLEAMDDCPDRGALRPREWCSSTGASFRLRGRIDTDAIWTSQRAANRATFGDLSDVVGLRRARIGTEGNLTPDSRYIAEIDLASGNIVVRDLFVGWGQIPETGEFRLGHMREPFSLEGGTSGNTLSFMERSPINNLDPARNWGLGYFRCSGAQDSTIALGIYQSGTDSSDLQGGDGSDTAATARWTMLPWNECEGEQLMHVGFALSARIPDRGVVVINQRPSSPLLDLGDSSASPFVPTIRIPSHFQQLFNAQWAFVDGPFWAQAEWYGSLIDQRGGDPIFLHGSYVDVGYFLTGEHRGYQTQNGTFGRIKVERPVVGGFSSHQHSDSLGLGAWELTARFAYLDFFDPDTPVGPQGQAIGVKLSQATFGVNWYLADRLRLMFNYTYAVPNEINTGTSSASVFSSRLAMFW